MSHAKRWELDLRREASIRWSRHAAEVPFYLAIHRLQEDRDGAIRIANPELLFLIWGTEEVFAGYLKAAIYHFEQQLLPTAEKHGGRWHGCVLLWSATYRLYACDPVGALGHVETAVKRDLVDMIPEIILLKGMALRLNGDPAGAIRVLEPLCPRESPLFPDGRTLATAWLLESQAAGGFGSATLEQMKWLERRSSNIYEGSLGILHAVLYRLVTSLDEQPKGVRTPKRLLAAMDRAAPFERPMLTMLLQDILPRPLRGVQPATKPPDAYWEE